MTERIYVGYSVASGLPYTGIVAGYHKLIIYENASGVGCH